MYAKASAFKTFVDITLLIFEHLFTYLNMNIFKVNIDTHSLRL